jgi:hypothetical protein
MPKNPVDYSKTIIYQIRCLDDDVDFVYVGHTINFRSRKTDHKKTCNNLDYKGSDFKLYQVIRDNGGWKNWEMIPLEEYACNSSTEARIREQEWIDKLQSKLNVRKAFLTEEEKRILRNNLNKNWRIANPERRKEQKAKERAKNAEHIKAHKNKKCDCLCGGKYTWANQAQHFRTLNHKNWWFMAFS